jgi:serine protease Do
VLNTRGEVVGIAVAAHLEDQCYALPINAAKKVCRDILDYGAARHPWVGLSVVERQVNILANDGARSAEWQVYVQEVYSNTPAADAGFRNKDLLVRICTNDLRRAADVLNLMFRHRCGDHVAFTVLRDGKMRELDLVVGTRPREQEMAVLPPLQEIPKPQQQPVLTIVPVSTAPSD